MSLSFDTLTTSAIFKCAKPGDMGEILQDIAKSSPLKFGIHHLAAISFNGSDEIIAWFNNYALHSAPMALELVHNAVIKTFCGDFYSIRVINEPLEFLPSVEYFKHIVMFVTGIGMISLSAPHLLFYIQVKKLFKTSCIVFDCLISYQTGKCV